MKKATGTSVLLVCVAVAATGVVVSSGMADAATESSVVATSTSTHPDLAATDLADRHRSVSRSNRRQSTRAAENLSLSQESGGQSTRTEDLITREPRTVARAMLPEFGFSDSEFGCLDALYVSESDWDPRADNPTSSAYGIPQALTGGTHDNLPSDYMTNPVSQIRWGLDYIRSSYGTPCSAWSFKQSNGWY
ncbi:MAG: lytic transglycosylase domain-containing protein [Nocardioidaceae bacterium]|nr:lytic transglycosylase domain-containing protein [Nocardioidaceae bacterium]